MFQSKHLNSFAVGGVGGGRGREGGASVLLLQET